MSKGFQAKATVMLTAGFFWQYGLVLQTTAIQLIVISSSTEFLHLFHKNKFAQARSNSLAQVWNRGTGNWKEIPLLPIVRKRWSSFVAKQTRLKVEIYYGCLDDSLLELHMGLRMHFEHHCRRIMLSRYISRCICFIIKMFFKILQISTISSSGCHLQILGHRRSRL